MGCDEAKAQAQSTSEGLSQCGLGTEKWIHEMGFLQFPIQFYLFSVIGLLPEMPRLSWEFQLSPLHLFLGASLLRVFNRILPPLASTVFVLIDQQCDCSYFAQNLPLVYLITERLKDFRRETRFARCYGSLSMSP